MTTGWSSFMIPSLATFFGQTMSTRSLNYHYKRNILATNLWLGLIFAGLALHLNMAPDSSALNRNHFLSCHDGNNVTKEELSPSSKECER